MGSYLFTTSHTSLTTPPSLTQLLSCVSASSSPSVSLLSLLLYSPPPTIPPPHPSFSHLWQCLFLSSCFLPVVESMPGLWHSHHFCPHPSPYLSFSPSPIPPPSSLSSFLLFSVFLSPLPFFSVSLHAGDWNVSSLCLRSWGGLSLEKCQSKKYSLTVNRSHCTAEWFNKTTRPW